MSVDIINGDALALPLEDSTVDLVVTSPPYWGIRDYEDDGQSVAGQVGQEGSLAGYIDSLIAATAESLRVLRPTGSIWVNLGDRFGPGGALLGAPWRYGIRAADDLGLTLRQEVIWNKPNGFTDSRPRGRLRRVHETWFHFTQGSDYYSDLAAIQTAPAADYQARPQYRRALQLAEAAGLTPEHFAAIRAVGIIDSSGASVRSGGSWTSQSGQLAAEARAALGSYYREFCGNGTAPKGQTPTTVQTIAAHPFKIPKTLGLSGHFASFPIEWPSLLIAGWCPPGGTVLDPFGGTGTTALAATASGRHGVAVDLSADYCAIARWRTTDPAQLRKARAAIPKGMPDA